MSAPWFERLRQVAADPPHRRIMRLARVGRAIGLAGEIPPARPLDLLRLVLADGANVRILYALHAILHGDRPALVDAKVSRSYAEVDKEIDRLANALRSRFGVDGTAAALLTTENRAEYLITWFALLRLGARAVHASWRATPAELEHMVVDAGVRVLLVSETSLAAARALRDSRPELALRLVVCDAAADTAAGEIAYPDLVADAVPSAPPPPVGPAGGNVVYTSGTTGRPKGAVRDFAAFGPGELARILERLPFRLGERHLIVAPLYHSSAQAFALLTIALGGTLHLAAHFDAADTLRTLSAQDIESVFLVPTMLQRLLDVGAEELASHPTPSLHAVVAGSAELTEPLRVAAISRFGTRAVFDFYGATELGWVTLARGDEMQERPGTVGRPLAGQRIRILDEAGRELPRDEIGLVYVANEQTMQGYLNNAAASRATRRGAWATVEDLGRVDADGYLYLAGRARDMVKSGGINLYPAEIEQVLRRDPTIRDVAVIGVPDPGWGERLLAVVVPSGDAFDAAAVEARARRELSSPKVPRAWRLVEELPRNPNGKVLKTELRARFAGP